MSRPHLMRPTIDKDLIWAVGAGVVDVENPKSTFGKHQTGNAGLININSGFQPESATPEALKLNEASKQKTYVAASLSEKGEQVKSNANHAAPMTAASIFGALVQIFLNI
jgi:hypothetical protein